MPRKPANFDDDEVAEKYVEKAEARHRKLEEAREIKRNLDETDDSLFHKVVAKVEQIVRNIENGDAVYKNIESAEVYVVKAELNSKDAVRVLVTPSHEDKGKTFQTTQDYKIFANLVADVSMDDSTEFSMGASPLLISCMNEYKDFETAIPYIVTEGVERGLIEPNDASRLTSLFKVWVRGVSWGKCVMSATHRPSLASWQGWPWEKDVAMERSLYRDIKGSNVVPSFTMVPMEFLVPPSHVDIFKPIWTAKEGVAAEGIEKAVRTSLDAAIALKASSTSSSSAQGAAKATKKQRKT